MRIISKNALAKFWETHPAAKVSLSSWYKTVRSCNWTKFSEVRETFRHADIYRDCVIFDVGGNKYRLVAKVRYRTKRVYIRYVLTHSDYDKNAWKEDCEC